jgi:hypothetical protein
VVWKSKYKQKDQNITKGGLFDYNRHAIRNHVWIWIFRKYKNNKKIVIHMRDKDSWVTSFNCWTRFKFFGLISDTFMSGLCFLKAYIYSIHKTKIKYIVSLGFNQSLHHLIIFWSYSSWNSTYSPITPKVTKESEKKNLIVWCWCPSHAL